jgi:hypothetical protein
MQNQNIKIAVSMKKSLLTLFLVGLVLLYKVKVQILVCQLSDFYFGDCENQEGIRLENCFYNKVQKFVLKIISYQKT